MVARLPSLEKHTQYIIKENPHRRPDNPVYKMDEFVPRRTIKQNINYVCYLSWRMIGVGRTQVSSQPNSASV